jgi:tRNA threonylcarbamoyladenosine biosynthesis protein TsaB
VRVLAIDTALGACAACILQVGAQDAEPEPPIQESLAMERGHAEALMPLIERVVKRSEGGFPGIDRIAVSVGPGSFTGLRVGISAARAIALGTGKPCVGVTTLSAYAAPVVASGVGTLVAAAVDARHGQVYLQVFGPAGRTVVAPLIVPARDAARQLGTGMVRIVGSGAGVLLAEALAIGLDAAVVDDGAAPDILWVARLGAVAVAERAPPKPVYLRPPDAKPQDHVRIPRR